MICKNLSNLYISLHHDYPIILILLPVKHTHTFPSQETIQFFPALIPHPQCYIISNAIPFDTLRPLLWRPNENASLPDHACVALTSLPHFACSVYTRKSRVTREPRADSFAQHSGDFVHSIWYAYIYVPKCYVIIMRTRAEWHRPVVIITCRFVGSFDRRAWAFLKRLICRPMNGDDYLGVSFRLCWVEMRILMGF